MGGSRQWAHQVEEFAGDFDVVTIDLPGFGENADMPAPNTIAGFANWVLNELSQCSIETFHLLGHSMGGMIVQEMTARAPQRINRLILYGTGATGILPGRFETIETSKRRAQADGPQATARRISATWFLDREDATEYPSCAEIAAKSSLQTILAGLDAMQGWSGVSHLPNIHCPTLILWGDRGRTYHWLQTEQLWTSIPGVSLAVIPDCAHAAHLEKQNLFNLLLGGFLENQR